MTIENYIQAGLQHLGIYSESISDIIYFMALLVIIGIINYGMTALMIPRSYQKIVMGALIIISVAIDHFVAKAKN